MDKMDADHSEDRGPMQPVKVRLLEFSIGLAAHYIRLIALAPILAAPIIALTMASALTQSGDALTPLLEWLVPEELHTFQGGIMEFGLPIAWKHRAVLLWAPIVLSVGEQVSGKRVRHVGLHAKFWLYTLLPAFGLITLYTLLFLDINDGRLTGSVIALIMNAILLTVALLGVGGLLVISLIERQLLHKINPPS